MIKRVTIPASLEALLPPVPPYLVGFPNKIRPIKNYVEPGITLIAEYLNWFFNQNGQAASDAQNAAISVGVGNWSPSISATSLLSGASLYSLRWDSFGQRWLAALVTAGGSVAVYASYDLGRTWSALLASTGSSATLFALSSNPGDGAPIAIGTNGSGSTGVFSGPALGTFLAQAGMAGTTSAECVFLQGSTNPGHYCYAVNQSGGTYTGKLLLSGNLDGTGSWSAFGSGLVPSNFNGGADHTGSILAANSTPATDSNGSRALFAIGGVTPGTDVARLMLVKETSFSFSELTPSFLGGAIITGVAYDPTTNTWAIASWNGTSSTFSISTTPEDPTSWTQRHGFLGSVIVGLGVVGGTWVLSLNPARVIYSSDGGATWSTASGWPSTPGRFAYSDGQIVSWSSSAIAASWTVGSLAGGSF